MIMQFLFTFRQPYYVTHKYIAFANYDNKLVTGEGISREVLMYDINATRKLWRTTNYSGYTQKILPLNNKIIVGTSTGTIQFWDIGTKSSVWFQQSHQTPILNLTTDIINNNLLLSTAHDQTIKLWDIRESACVGSQKLPYQPHSFTTFGGNIIVGCNNGSINILNNDFRTIKIVHNNSGAISNLIIMNNTLISACDSGTIKTYSLPDFTCTSTLIGHTKPINHLIPLDDASFISTGFDKLVKIWDLHKTNNACRNTLEAKKHIYAAAVINDKIITGANKIDVYSIK